MKRAARFAVTVAAVVAVTVAAALFVRPAVHRQEREQDRIARERCAAAEANGVPLWGCPRPMMREARRP